MRIQITSLLMLASLILTSCAKERSAPVAPADSPRSGRASERCAARFVRSSACLSWSWEQKPTTEAMGIIRFQISASTTSPLQDLSSTLQPELVLWMPSMGHGSSPTTVTRLGAGDYRASDVFFIMPGNWELRFQIGQSGNLQDEAVVELTIE